MRINEAIDEWLTRYRDAYDLTLDQIATETRSFGTAWSVGFISGIGKANTSAALQNLIVLVRSVNSLTGEHNSLSSVFHGNGDIELNEYLTVTRKELRKMLEGNSIEVTAPTKFSEDRNITRLSENLLDEIPSMVKSLSENLFTMLSDSDRKTVEEHEPTLAERRASKKLSLTPVTVAAACQIKYGAFLDEEAVKRAGTSSSPQKRGRETRKIIEELDLWIDDLLNSRAETDSYRAMHVSDLGLAAKHGDTNGEQEAYEAEP
ncbi:hypothetical protein [Bifidobacterium crudilactis]|jgi:hypothetical protein|uniref:hypothetical protein n=1 Tax=Bifidobacterium crudilactis TaxID=327277 RepID=UPI002F35481B